VGGPTRRKPQAQNYACVLRKKALGEHPAQTPEKIVCACNNRPREAAKPEEDAHRDAVVDLLRSGRSKKETPKTQKKERQVDSTSLHK